MTALVSENVPETAGAAVAKATVPKSAPPPPRELIEGQPRENPNNSAEVVEVDANGPPPEAEPEIVG